MHKLCSITLDHNLTPNCNICKHIFGIKIPIYPPQNTNPRIIEDTRASARLDTPTNSSLSDAALRRGIEESLTQYEFDRVYHLQLEEAVRASRAQQNSNSINISTGRSTTTSSATIRQQRLLHLGTFNYAETNEPTERSTTLPSTAVTIGSATTLSHRSASQPRRTAEELISSSSTPTTNDSSQLPTQTVPPTVSSSTAEKIEEGFIL